MTTVLSEACWRILVDAIVAGRGDPPFPGFAVALGVGNQEISDRAPVPIRVGLGEGATDGSIGLLIDPTGATEVSITAPGIHPVRWGLGLVDGPILVIGDGAAGPNAQLRQGDTLHMLGSTHHG